MTGCCPTKMPRSVGKGPSGNAKKQITREGVKHMPRTASEHTMSRSNWRAKNKPDPMAADFFSVY